MAPRGCHFFADLFTLAVLFSFVVVGLYFSVKNANEKYGAGVHIPFILPKDESHFDDVREFLIESGVSSPETLDIFGSPQHNALYWVSETDDRGLKIDNPNLIQRYTLAVLYYATNGANWVNNENYLTDVFECMWHGVACNNETKVVNLTLASNNMVGNLPSEIASLTSLERLNLKDNKLSGDYVRPNLCNHTKLEALDLSFNDLSGTVPFIDSACNKLTLLRVSHNFYTGTLSTSVNSLSKLKTLDLGYNQLSGENLKLFGLASLNDLLLGHNNFNGTLPGDLYFLRPTLKRLELFRNDFTGTFPDNYRALVNLESLQVAGNRLTGTIPGSIKDMVFLNDLTVQLNNFTGDMPQEVCDITSLTTIIADCDCPEGLPSLDSCTCCTSCCCAGVSEGDNWSCTDLSTEEAG